MSRGYDIVFPAKGRLTFDGGQNSKFARSVIADNESPDCQDVVFSNGAVETRGGSTKLNTASVGSFVVDGLYTRHDNTGTETMVVFAGGTMWALTGTSTFATVASGQSVFSAGLRVGTAQYENHMFIGNGSVTPYKYNGTDFTRHGVPRASVSGFTGAVSGGGSLTTDTYYYKVSFVNSQVVQGDVSTATTAFTVSTASGVVNLSGIPTAPTSHGVNARRIYRANTSTAGSFALLATLNDNTTTAYVDTGSTTPAGAAPTDNGEPPNYGVIAYHQNRLFCNDPANPNYVWYSELFEPYTFASTNFRPVGDGSFDLVKGIEVYDNGIMVLCERSLQFIYMPSVDDSDWQTIRIRSPYGSKSPFGAFLYNNKLMIAAMQNDKFVGFAGISGGTVDPEATMLETSRAGSDLKSERVEDEMFSVWEPAVGQISAMVFKNRAYITVPSGTNQTTNNRCFYFDFSISNLSKQQEASWTPVDGINASQFTIYNGKLYYGTSTATGFVYELETTSYNDNGAAIDSYFWTKEFAGNPGHENLQKDFRRVKLLVDKSGPYYMNLTYRVDSDSGDGITKQVDLDPGSAIWGSFVWGIGVWGGGREQEEITVTLGQVTGKRIQLRFSNQNTANQKFKVHGANIYYNLKGRR